MTRKTTVLIAAGLVLTPSLVVLREILAARSCAAAGGGYDFLRALCFMPGSQEAASTLHNPLLWVGVFLVAKVTAVVMFGFRNPLLALGAACLVASRRLISRALTGTSLALRNIRPQN